MWGGILRGSNGRTEGEGLWCSWWWVRSPMSGSAEIQTELGELLRSSGPRMFSSNFLGPEKHESLVKNIEVPIPPLESLF